MDFGKYGAWRRINEWSSEAATAVEEMGYGAIWAGGSPSADLEAVEALLAATRVVPVATGIVNMWRADPEEVARSYHRIESRHPGRFYLGLGIGHPESTSEYQRPFDKMVEYLDRVEAAGVPGDRVILAALGPKVLRLAARRTFGAHPYFTTPRHTHMAREVMGPDAFLAPEHKVVFPPDAWEELARPNVARYLRLENYRANLRREGWDESDLEGSDRLTEALVLRGDPQTVAASLAGHLEAGADHVCVQVLGDDPVPGYSQLASALFG
ncbi:MAG TPA: LLM class F420-dependent oxidoreductase [Acidimicrobiia bacterium]